jgi:hypothetical protein
MNSTYEIEINTEIVSYRTRAGVTPTGGVYGGEWMDGDYRTLSSNAQTLVMDDDDLELFEGVDSVHPEHTPRTAWAVYVIDTTTDAIHPSSSPIGDSAREHEWLSGSYEDPYEGDNKVTETSVRLTGDWTPEERAIVFKTITGKYHTA